MEDQLSQYVNIERGVCQGCAFSPDLFNLYSEMTLREIKDLEGISVGGKNINNFRYYADDTVLISTTEGDLQQILDKVVQESAQ